MMVDRSRTGDSQLREAGALCSVANENSRRGQIGTAARARKHAYCYPLRSSSADKAM